jgi:hypothetical protein
MRALGQEGHDEGVADDAVQPEHPTEALRAAEERAQPGCELGEEQDEERGVRPGVAHGPLPSSFKGPRGYDGMGRGIGQKATSVNVAFWRLTDVMLSDRLVAWSLG